MKILSLLLILTLSITSLILPISASDFEDITDNGINSEADILGTSGEDIELSAISAILMDAETGTVLYSKNPGEPLPPASVTKIMTLLLVAEAIRDGEVALDDKVIVSANAASMGGSQIFIKEGEEFTVEELLKSTVIASANDAAVALAEQISGSEASFVKRMNERASELGMKNTTFENVTGLDDTVTKHLTSAYDIALMSKELIKHDVILKYSGIWQDSIRDGEFILTNTNRLVRYYDGCTGLKTGSTDKAGFCISATAKRDGMHLISVIMGAPTRDERNKDARALLDYGFAEYKLYKDPASKLEEVDVRGGTIPSTSVYSKGFSLLVNSSDYKRIEKKYDIPEAIYAPIEKGAKVGRIVYSLDGKELGSSDIIVSEDIRGLGYFDILLRLLSDIACKKAKDAQ